MSTAVSATRREGSSRGDHHSSVGPRLSAKAAASLSSTSHDGKRFLTRISNWPQLRTCVGRRDCVMRTFISCLHGPAVSSCTSQPATYSDVLLFVLRSAAVGGTQTCWDLWLTGDCTSFTGMDYFADGRSLLKSTLKVVRTTGVYQFIYGCYKGRLRGALGVQKALGGAIGTSAPKLGAHSTSLLL